MRSPGQGKRNPYCAKPWDWRPYDSAGAWTVEELEFDRGWRAAYFIETFLRHSKGRWQGQPFILTPTELEIVLYVFGTVDADQLRVVRKVWIEWARKNGKSELAAAVALYLLYADGENSAEIYGAANDREQASLVFNVAASMVEGSPLLADRARIYRPQKRIVVGRSFYVAIPADVAGAHGYSASGVIFDEVHTQPTRDLWDVLTTSFGAREQPLIFAITTAGTDRESLAGQLHSYADQVQRGVIDDSSWYVDIRNTPEDADWRDESNWAFANPHLGTREEINAGTAFRSLEDMRLLAAEAEHITSQQTVFRNLFLNQWTQSAEQWLDLSVWDQGATPFDVEELEGRKCYAGLDLAATKDVTAYALLFPFDDSVLRVIWRYFLPEKWVQDRPNHPLSRWAREGRIIITPGDVVDFEEIDRRISADADRYQIKELGHDPWQSTMLVGRLADRGMTVVRVPQGPSTLNAPTKEVERLVAASKLHHNGDPVARWMADNAVVKVSGDLVRLSKEKAAEKIDGISALVNAVERWMHAEPESRVRVYTA